MRSALLDFTVDDGHFLLLAVLVALTEHQWLCFVVQMYGFMSSCTCACVEVSYSGRAILHQQEQP